ncbi:MAG: heat-inducible transcriptional repressor HrcA, partial [Euzebyales bacterium]|nr:heat-inducible transcriptional repressor HrcA [Euzebyales bacterium]
MPALDERRSAILRAIVQDYVRAGEPVGSKRLVEDHALGVSAATVRGEMAALEESGFITHPHTSAGRVPTDKGYRYFVDTLTETAQLEPAQAEALEGLLLGSVDLEDLLRRTSSV